MTDSQLGYAPVVTVRCGISGYNLTLRKFQLDPQLGVQKVCFPATREESLKFFLYINLFQICFSAHFKCEIRDTIFLCPTGSEHLWVQTWVFAVCTVYKLCVYLV